MSFDVGTIPNALGGPVWGVVAFGVITAVQLSLWLERIAKDIRTIRGLVETATFKKPHNH